ncbi:MAG TPA: Hsp20/alpha crystallin family protein [Verrucomicrobiota bacterium]|jgi:HSP20 family protein|nr:Hsp20/alpha crystallin family protein [Verrucomicrobiota bacterium]OQB89775.1 MAG: Spore protein SP21 [Verrucomicrobia bacterium ADurb.Bin118]HPY29349.1 Hsp20/alpha crystallin family protein [Verrucomicrobiota bacterium]HQB15932.1 Hsp20/alpha crystallin family protein [Verrucomicrobiota bacterium]
MGKVSSSVHFIERSTMVVTRDLPGKTHWEPNTDLYTTADGLVIKVELAGMRSENLEVTLEGNRLRISGNRPDSCRAAHCRFLMMEITYGPFEKVLNLPPGYDLSRAKAAYVNGFLRVDVPLAQAPAPDHKLEISEGD